MMKAGANRANQTEDLRFAEYRKQFLLLLGFFAMVGVVVIGLIHSVQRRSVLDHVKADAREIVDAQAVMVSEMLGFIASDLMVVAHGAPLHHYFETRNPDILRRYAEQVRTISQSKMIYDQIRVLDKDGM